VYWFQSLLTLLLPLALLPIVLVWFWRALRRLDAARLADQAGEAPKDS
jgi:hypothetical protein